MRNSTYSLIKRSEEFMREIQAHMEKLTADDIKTINEKFGKL
jgi:hypothetical protein